VTTMKPHKPFSMIREFHLADPQPVSAVHRGPTSKVERPFRALILSAAEGNSYALGSASPCPAFVEW
jgi:hypothetical protein